MHTHRPGSSQTAPRSQAGSSAAARIHAHRGRKVWIPGAFAAARPTPSRNACGAQRPFRKFGVLLGNLSQLSCRALLLPDTLKLFRPLHARPPPALRSPPPRPPPTPEFSSHWIACTKSARVCGSWQGGVSKPSYPRSRAGRADPRARARRRSRFSSPRNAVSGSHA